MDVLKDKLNAWIDQINAEIDASPNGQTVNDIAVSFEKLFCRNIVHISFGEDVSDMKIEIDFLKNPTGSEFARKSVPLAEAIHEYNDIMFSLGPSKWLNPVYQAIRSVTGIKYLTSYQRKVAENGQRIRDSIQNYINQRKSGERKSQVADGVDLLSLFLS